MKKYLTTISIFFTAIISSNANSVSLDDISALNLPVFGMGHDYNVCYLHGQPFALVTSTEVCDVELLNTNQQSNILTSQNIVFVNNKTNSFWLNSPQHWNLHAAGDPDCYDRKPLSFSGPTW